MPIMTRMRDSMPIILFGLLIAFLITIVFEWGMDYLGLRSTRSDTIGKINGKKITYQEFSELVKNATEGQKPPQGNEPDEAATKQTRDQVWQNLVTQHLIDEQINKLGITVTDQELLDWVRGDNPPEDLKRNFIDSTGAFRKDIYDQFLANPNQFLRDPKKGDPNFGLRWLAEYEKNLRQRRLQEKLQSLVQSSVRVNEGEIRRRYIDQNQKYDALFTLLDPGQFVRDDEVQVSDAELKSFYEENIDQYKIEASRSLKYVVFLETASSSDSLLYKSELEDALQKARSGIDFVQLTATYGEKPDSGTFFKHGELTPTIESAVFGATRGDIIGPLLENDGYHLIKVLDERKGSNEFLRARHILFSLDPTKDTNAVKATAQEVMKRARQGEDFAQLAIKYSTDQGSAAKGGDLGWFGKNRMVKPFEDAAFKARVGEIVGPVRSPFGLHIIKVLERDMREVKISSIVSRIKPGSQTRNDVAERAKDFAYNAKKEDFVKEAQASGFEVKEAEITEKMGFIPGIGMNESITKWAFNDKVGSVSDPYTVPNGWAVFAVVAAKSAGVKPVDDVKEVMKPQIIRKKKIERLKQIAGDYKARLAPNDSLTKLEGTGIRVQRTGQFNLMSGAPGIGRDPQFLGAVTALSPGQISSPVSTLRGVFLIQLVSRTPFDSTAYTTQREVLRSQMLQEKRNRYISEWLAKLKENAEIEDDRDKFYR